MTASTWPRTLSLKRAHVFAYIMNNYWYTNYKASQGGRQVFRFSLTSARGGFSKRDAEIDQALAQLLVDKPELADANIAALRARRAGPPRRVWNSSAAVTARSDCAERV